MGIQDGKSLGRGLDNMLGKGRNLFQCDAIVSLEEEPVVQKQLYHRAERCAWAWDDMQMPGNRI